MHTLPKKGQPLYKWLDLESPKEAAKAGSAGPRENQTHSNRVHVRLEFSEREEKQACMALDVALRGIGVSVIDCISTRHAQELIFIHMMDVRVRCWKSWTCFQGVGGTGYVTACSACRGASSRTA